LRELLERAEEEDEEEEGHKARRPLREKVSGALWPLFVVASLPAAAELAGQLAGQAEKLMLVRVLPVEGRPHFSPPNAPSGLCAD